MTTTTPESRATIAYVSYHRTLAGPGTPVAFPSFLSLGMVERAAWLSASEIVWSKARSGQSRGDVLSASPRPSGLSLDRAAWASAVGVLWDLAVTGRATI
jgi:hypothetical protein